MFYRLSHMLRFIIIVGIVALSGCNIVIDNNQTCDLEIDVDHPVIITNRSATITTFNVSWNGSFMNMDSVLNGIKQLPNDFNNEPLERKSWRFVIGHMDFYRNPLASPAIHHPLIQLNSIGYGQCDDLATLLYFIWIRQGFKARIWGLGNHVVPEVYVNGTWQMYDPSFQSYYLNKSGIPASVSELSHNNSLILNPYKTFTLKESNNIPSKIIDSLRYGMSVCRHFLSEKTHFENKTYYNTTEVPAFLIQLPPRCSISFPIYKPQIMQQVDWFDKSRDNHYYLKLIIPANSQGIIKLPLILVSVDGDIILRSSDNSKMQYSFSGKTSKPLEIIDTALSIVSACKTTVLYYKIPEKFSQKIHINISKISSFSPQITQKN